MDTLTPRTPDPALIVDLSGLTFVTGPILSGKTHLLHTLAASRPESITVVPFKDDAHRTEWGDLEDITVASHVPAGLGDGDLLLVDEAWAMSDTDVAAADAALDAGVKVVLASATIDGLDRFVAQADRHIVCER